MAPYRGGRIGRGGRGGRGTFQGSGKLARSGIRTRAGYRRFDSQRVKDVESSEDGSGDEPEENEQQDGEDGDASIDEDVESAPKVRAYNTLLQSFQQPPEQVERKRKRRKLDMREEPAEMDGNVNSDDENAGVEVDNAAEDEALDQTEAEEMDENIEDDEDTSDPFEAHFANPDDNDLSRRLKSIQANEWRTEKQNVFRGDAALTVSAPQCASGSLFRKAAIKTPTEIHLKKRLSSSSQKQMPTLDDTQQVLLPYISNYTDVLFGGRTPSNAASLRQLACLHALNHVLKGRDKVLKNNSRTEDSNPDLDLRDQGYTRPKVLILTETRQMCFNYASTLAEFFEPEQQENKQRFHDSFFAPLDDEKDMPEDYKDLFQGNNDNNFLTAIKITRKTLKFYSAFYTSDIILASPLGLRRILENEDVKKRDHDFLSSIELVVCDQAAAMQMQNWQNVESVFQHLNLPLKEAHGCDFSRVRSYYLDGNAKFLRQTLMFSGYVTPEMNRLYNTAMLNVAGKAKVAPLYSQNAAITAVSNSGSGSIKQTFSRFDSSSPATDPDARFKYFTTAILPSLLRTPKPAEGGKGILIFIPSYYDFLRLRNHFATSSQTQNISFGAIHEYTEVAEQRRARAHFLSGRHSFLLYTQRAHHFFRLKIKGVRRVVMYGLPDNPAFYEEIGGGFLETSLRDGKVGEGEAAARTMFSRWDALPLERVVGSARVKSMLGAGAASGDTFEFV